MDAEGNVRIKNRTEKQKKDLIARLNRVEGQVRGIRGMVEKDIYCDDILNQISAVQSALKSVSKLILEGHMKSCLIDRIQAGDTEVVDELLNTIGKMM
jgi:DNA-binding FrmR family transcriptional regulator